MSLSLLNPQEVVIRVRGDMWGPLLTVLGFLQWLLSEAFRLRVQQRYIKGCGRAAPAPGRMSPGRKSMPSLLHGQVFLLGLSCLDCIMGTQRVSQKQVR